MSDNNPIGEYVCPTCGSMYITDPKTITVFIPEGLEKPTASIKCVKCGKLIKSEIRWEDAILFDSYGANIEGYSFVHGAPLTPEEIDEFVVNFDEHIKRFFEKCSK